MCSSDAGVWLEVYTVMQSINAVFDPLILPHFPLFFTLFIGSTMQLCDAGEQVEFTKEFNSQLPPQSITSCFYCTLAHCTTSHGVFIAL